MSRLNRTREKMFLRDTRVIDLAIHMIGYYPIELEANFQSALDFGHDVGTINKLILVLNSRWGMEMRLLESEEE